MLDPRVGRNTKTHAVERNCNYTRRLYSAVIPSMREAMLGLGDCAVEHGLGFTKLSAIKQRFGALQHCVYLVQAHCAYSFIL
jgi:hypothetical protein